jgi:hypothetical protein
LGIVVGTFPQEIRKSRLELCPFQDRSGNEEDGMRLRARQRAPDVRSLEIGSWSARYSTQLLRESKGRSKNDKQQTKVRFGHISTSSFPWAEE